MKRLVDKKHLLKVASLPCACCGFEYGVVAHHLMQGVTRGVGRKADDCFVIPLCVAHHRALHDHGGETKYLSQHGIDGKALAAELYYNYKNS